MNTRNDNEITPVLFRIDNNSGIEFAIFPYISYSRSKRTLIYCPLGQHFEGDYGACIRKSKPAKPEEYKRLYSELVSLGYQMRVINRARHRKMYQL